MNNRINSNREGLKVKVDYVESKLDEAVRSLKEVIEKSEARLEADRQAAEKRLEADRQAAEARLTEERKEFKVWLAEERKEFRATRRVLYANFIAIIVLIFTVIGILITAVNGSLLH